jgi:hypothetical protein
MKTFSTLLAGSFLVAVLPPALAQSPGAINQVDSAQQRLELEASMKSLADGDNAPEFYPGESGDVGPQSVLLIKPRRTHFEAQADVQYFYTDNMFLLEDTRQSAGVLLSTVQFALAPTAYELGSGQFAPRLGYRHQWFDYGLGDDTLDNSSLDLSDFNFNAQTVFMDGRWSRNNWVFLAGFDYTRLLDSSDYDDFYQEYVPRWGVQRLVRLSESSTLSVGYEGDYRFTDSTTLPAFLPSDMMDRMDHALFAAGTVALCEHVVVQPFYRFTYTHFTEDGNRDDYLHSAGLGVYGFITPNITVRAFVNYDARNSSESQVPEYHQFSAGGGVNVTARF